MKFSVLLCTCNRHELLARSLPALIERTESKPDEIVVVNGGDERADEVVNSYTSDHRTRVKLIRTVNKNLAASRNVGLAHCEGDIIAMTDDDAEVFPNWVTLLKQIHAEHPEAGGVGGAVIGSDSDSVISRVADQVTFPNFLTARTVRTLPGVNVSYKRQAMEKAGLQDESLFRGEDVDYNWRLQKLGWTIWYDPRVRVRHHHRPTLRALLNQHYMYGRAYYLVRRKWREMYCVYPHSFRRPKDFFKLANFFAGIFYEPLVNAARMKRPTDRLFAYPLLVAVQFAWRGGMLREKFATR